MNDFYAYKTIINEKLKGILGPEKIGDGIVSDAMRYSVENGGKRVRPILTLEFCRVCGGDISNALDLACAIELIHTYSPPNGSLFRPVRSLHGLGG